MSQTYAHPENVEWISQPAVRKAAEQGNADAQWGMGLLCMDGVGGVPHNDREAVEWFRKSAEQGHAKAQDCLGSMYLLGRGITQDFVQAHMWLNLAAAQGVKEAIKNRDRIAGRMTPAEIAQAEAMASEWMSANADSV